MHAYFTQLKYNEHALEDSLKLVQSFSICVNERKHSSRRTPLIGLRFVPSETVFS